MIYLMLSVGALAFGPLIYRLAVVHAVTLSLLDSFIFVVICGLVIFHLLPHSIHMGHWIAIGAALIGFLGPAIAERLLHRAAAQVHLLSLILAIIGFGGHALLDGMVLAGPQGQNHPDSAFALAIILHRVPDGLTIWWLLREPYGVRTAIISLLVMAVATIIGFFLGGTAIISQSQTWVGVVQALVAGSLVHVVLHRPHIPSPSGKGRAYLTEIAGALVGGFLLMGIEGVATHEAGHTHDVQNNFIGAAIFGLLLFLRYGYGRMARRLGKPSISHAHEHHTHHHATDIKNSHG
jgi:hypothetical protein